MAVSSARFTHAALQLALLATLALPAFTPAVARAAEDDDWAATPTAAAAPAQEAPRPRLFLPFLSGGSGTPLPEPAPTPVPAPDLVFTPSAIELTPVQ